MIERTKEFLIDCVSRILQIIFGVLIIGPFVRGFNVWLFILGVVLYVFFFILGFMLTEVKEGE